MSILRRNHSREKTPDSNFTSNRIEAFSDGVIAIIITLMILEIKIPEMHGNSNLDVWRTLKPLIPHVVAYMLSFVMLGIYWVNHHNFFHKIKHGTRGILWLNLNLLFWMSLIPIPTGILGNNPGAPQSSVLYGFILFMTSASFTYMGVYANRKGLFTGKVPDDVRKRNMRRNLLSLGIYVAAMLLAHLNVYISFALFVLVAAMFFMPRLGTSSAPQTEKLLEKTANEVKDSPVESSNESVKKVAS